MNKQNNKYKIPAVCAHCGLTDFLTLDWLRISEDEYCPKCTKLYRNGLLINDLEEEIE